jgi:hypothetical protein
VFLGGRVWEGGGGPGGVVWCSSSTVQCDAHRDGPWLLHVWLSYGPRVWKESGESGGLGVGRERAAVWVTRT